MKYLFLLCSAAASLFLAGCTDFFSQTIETEAPQYNKSLVFHTLLSDNDSIVRVVLSRNYGIFDNVQGDKSWFVRGAKVEWWVNGAKAGDLTPLRSTSGEDSTFVYEFRLPQKLQKGQTCEIRISHPDFEPVRAVQTMPSLLQPTGAPRLLRDVQTIPLTGEKLNEVSVTLQDVPGEKNYYEFAIFNTRKYLSGIFDPATGQVTFDTIEYTRSYSFEENNNDPSLRTGVGNSALLSDQFFDGQPYTFKGRFVDYNFGNVIDSSGNYTFMVRQCTEEYYRWSRSYFQQFNTQGNPFAEPVSVFNNLENGLGVFGLFSERRYKLK
jgi:hypothetical protein